MVSAFVTMGESGGDFYNYLLMGKSLLAGGSIFIEKRLPVYALMLIPGHIASHPLGWARFLGIVLALLTLYFLYKLLIDLRLPKAAALTSLILLSWQPTFFLFSIRPLSHTLFDFEVIFSLFMFYKITRGLVSSEKFSKLQIVQFVAFSLVLGLTAMTRHEGFLVAGVLIGYLIVNVLWRIWCARQLIYVEPPHGAALPLLTVISFAFIVLPWFISNFQRFGNPFYTQYQTDAGLNVAYTSEKLLGNAFQMRDMFLGMWGNLGFVSVKQPWLMLTRAESFGEVVTVLTVILMLAGLVVFVRRLKWAAAPVILLFLTQFAFLTVVQPWSRHSQHILFVPAILLSLGLYSILSFKFKKVAGVLTIFFLLPVLIYLVRGDQAAVEGYINGGQKTLSLMRASETLQQKFPEGKVLVSEKFKTDWSDEFSLIDYYLGNRITYSLSDNPKYILDYNGTITAR